MIEVRRKGIDSSLLSSSSSNDPGETTARPQLPTTSASVGTMEEGVRHCQLLHCQLPTALTDSAVDVVAVGPQLPAVSTDCSVEMVGTEEVRTSVLMQPVHVVVIVVAVITYHQEKWDDYVYPPLI